MLRKLALLAAAELPCGVNGNLTKSCQRQPASRRGLEGILNDTPEPTMRYCDPLTGAAADRQSAFPSEPGWRCGQPAPAIDISKFPICRSKRKVCGRLDHIFAISYGTICPPSDIHRTPARNALRVGGGGKVLEAGPGARVGSGRTTAGRTDRSRCSKMTRGELDAHAGRMPPSIRRLRPSSRRTRRRACTSTC
jgi:hypothetical protein